MYRIERQRTPGRMMVGYSYRFEEKDQAIARAKAAAETNAQAMQYGRYVVIDCEDGAEVFALRTEPLVTPLWATTIEED